MKLSLRGSETLEQVPYSGDRLLGYSLKQKDSNSRFVSFFIRSLISCWARLEVLYLQAPVSGALVFLLFDAPREATETPRPWQGIYAEA